MKIIPVDLQLCPYQGHFQVGKCTENSPAICCGCSALRSPDSVDCASHTGGLLLWTLLLDAIATTSSSEFKEATVMVCHSDSQDAARILQHVGVTHTPTYRHLTEV